MRAHPVRLGTVVALMAAQCGGNLPPVWLLSGFRVIGVQESPAESMHGGTVTLTAVTLDTRVRTPQIVWGLCGVPLAAVTMTGTSASAGALAGFGACPADQLQVAMGPTVTFTIPDATGLLDEYHRDTFNVLGYACSGGTLQVPTTGTDPPQCMGANATGWLFTRTVTVHTAASINPPNQNPQIAEVRFGGASTQPITLDAPPSVPVCTDTHSPPQCTTWHLEIAFTSGSRETYTGIDPLTGNTVAMQQERLTTGYVVTAGTLSGGFRTDNDTDPASAMEDDWYAPPTPGTVDVYVYAVDGRGGFDWTHRSITAR